MITPDFDAFLNWERTSRDTIDVKKIYIDMADDLIAGVMLSQIVYWYLPSKEGNSKITITKGGKEWIAKTRYDWWDECRITPKQADRALRLLRTHKIIETKLYKFKNAPTQHIRILKEPFLIQWNRLISTKGINPFLPKGEKPISTKGENEFTPKVEINFTDSGKSLTESTPKTTPEITPIEVVVPPAAPQPQAPAAQHDDDATNILPIEQSVKPIKPVQPQRNTSNGHAQKPSAPQPPSIAGGSPLSANPPFTRVVSRWTELRTGRPKQEKVDEQLAEIRTDLDELGEKILMDAMNEAEAAAEEKRDKVYSWNFVRCFYPSEKELAKLKRQVDLMKFVDNTPPDAELGDTA